MADNKDATSLHIVVFPWLAFGHMLPFLELSKSLARRGHRISFISTPRNIQRLPKLPPEIAHLIDLVAFDLPQTDGLPEGAESTRDVPPDAGPCLKKALDGLEQPFANFIRDAISPKPNWIVQDFVQHWIPQIADEANVPTIYFSTVPANSLAFHGTEQLMAKHGPRVRPEQLAVSPPWFTFPSKLAYRPHEARKLIEQFAKTRTHAGLSDGQRAKVVSQACKALAVRSSVELEGSYMAVLADIFEKPVIPVGILPPPVADDGSDGGDGNVNIIEWLNKRRSKSVVYVALGSEVMLSDGLMLELAHGLELAKLPFLWAVRRPAGVSDDVNVLPEGFVERTDGYGLVCRGWVPQLKILAHEAVGGFLTHVGWSSTIESLCCGQPLVMLPVFGDQCLNARLMDELGVGVEVEKDEDDGSFTGESVAKALKSVMLGGGEAYRLKAQEFKDVFANKESQEKYMDGFIQFLQGNKYDCA